MQSASERHTRAPRPGCPARPPLRTRSQRLDRMSPRRPRLRAERFIAEHLTDPELNAEAVASHMAMSLRNLSRVFEKHNCSLTKWIWQERLALTRRQLADPTGARSIGDIAMGCGFSTQAHFSREFKQRYGITPTQHRETCAGIG